MKKKIIGSIVLVLLIGSSLSLIGSSHTDYYINPEPSPSNEDDCGCESKQTASSHLSLSNDIFFGETTNLSPKPTIRDDLPPYFNWRDINGTDWVSSVKDQGNCGSCWDFAAIGALESIIQIREGCAGLNLDLSEQYVLSCLPAAGSCNGGWAYNAYRWIKSNASAGNYCNGIIPEFCFPYQINDTVPCANASPDWQDHLIPISTYGRWVPDGSVEDRNAMKTQIMESGPIVTSMLFTIWNHGPDNLEEWGYTHHAATDCYLYPGPVPGTNHQVVIVGWKDDTSLTNGGYWIVKNSLSEEWGYDGFFNIEYGSLNIDSADIDWVEYHAANYSNWMPVARINTSSQGQVFFDGSGSFDHEGIIVSYEWDFGDGATATGVTATHTYAAAGIYQVTLTVTDNESNTDTKTTWVFINTENHPPKTPSILGRRNGKNGTTYRYTFWTTDPDGDDIEYYLNWGDDYWFGGAAGWIGPFKSGEKITLQKTWKEKGNYTVRVKAKDCYGAKSEWTMLAVTMPVSYDIPRLWEGLLLRFPFLERLILFISGLLGGSTL
ncbi:MAG: PKD domain-containing protein [Candidatus Thermoplasmatota archaeon]|nr:PKD domain-containing protein [Candidatus Thermoplasmatota archaeon]